MKVANLSCPRCDNIFWNLYKTQWARYTGLHSVYVQMTDWDSNVFMKFSICIPALKLFQLFIPELCELVILQATCLFYYELCELVIIASHLLAASFRVQVIALFPLPTFYFSSTRIYIQHNSFQMQHLLNLFLEG